MTGLAGSQTSGYILKISDEQALVELNDTGLEVAPLISYPSPSSEVLAKFGDYYVVKISSNLCGSNLYPRAFSAIPGVEAVFLDDINYLEPLAPATHSAPPFPDSSWGQAYVPNDFWYDRQWDRTIIRADWAWNVSFGGSDIIVALLDTGIDTTHPDLTSNRIPGYNFVEENSSVQDAHGHGTTVAGIVGAEIDNLEGIAGISQSSLMPVKVVADNGYYTNSDLAQGLIYAADQGAHIISMSLSGDMSEVLDAAIRYAWDEGCFICCSAGNDNADSSAWPAAHPCVMSVGATDASDGRYSRSNYGQNVDVFAPGYEIFTTQLGGSYNRFSGTSMASPQVAGIAALVWSVNPACTNIDICEAITSSADTIEVDIGQVLRAACGMMSGSAPTVQADSLSFYYDVTGPTAYSLEVFDITGRKVYAAQGQTSYQGRLDHAPNLPAGVYFWVMRTRFGSSQGKLVYLK